MAQQLEAAGEKVELLAFIDVFLPGKLQYLHSRPASIEYLDRHLGNLLLLPGFERLRYLSRGLASIGNRLNRFLGRSDKGFLARMTRKIAVAHHRAILSYQPKPYAGRIVQLLCSDAPNRVYEDRRLAWSALVSGGFELRVVPGNHLTMVEEPNASILARELQACLDRQSAYAPHNRLQAA